MAPQVVAELALREGAELAAIRADVRVVDVPINDIGDRVSDHVRSELIGRRANGSKVRARRLKEASDLSLGQSSATRSLPQQRHDADLRNLYRGIRWQGSSGAGMPRVFA